jgi:hypothetical protein
VIDAEGQFAARIAEDLEFVVGPAIAVDDVDLVVGDGASKVTVTLRVGDQVETIEAVGRDVLSLYQPIVRQAAETRLAAAYRRLLIGGKP